MKRLLFATCCILTAFSALAQSKQERIAIKGGSELWSNFMKEMYKYPSFVEGSVAYTDGQIFTRPMNYNKILATVQFIENGDTLAIANEHKVKSVSIGSDVFLYRPECMQDLSLGGEVRLLKNESLRIADIRRKGAYGTTNSSSAIESNNQIYASSNAINLDINETLLLYRNTNYYIQSPKNEILPASKKNILLLFPRHEDRIKEFMKSSRTNFNKEEDVLALTQFISQL